MSTLDAVMLGLVEGLTEFLPVSSTGHLILVTHLLGLEGGDFVKSFTIVIQLGAILAVIVIYGKRLVGNAAIWRRVVLGFVPTGIVGFMLYPLVRTYLIGNDLVVVIALVGVGLLLIAADRYLTGRETFEEVEDIPLTRALVVGVFQAVAVVPGVSRSGSTIVGGMLAGLSRRAAAEFSFMLAVPTMLAASGYDLLRSGAAFSSEHWGLLAVGFVTAFIVAILSIRFMLSLLSRYGFLPFGLYRVAIGGIYALVFLR